MGMSPSEVLALPFHDYQAALHHYNKAQAGSDSDDAPLGGDDFDEMLVGLAGAGLTH